VLPTTATQADVYQAAVQPVVEDVLDGYNGTIMAYGQTGRGQHACVCARFLAIVIFWVAGLSGPKCMVKARDGASMACARPSRVSRVWGHCMVHDHTADRVWGGCWRPWHRHGSLQQPLCPCVGAEHSMGWYGKPLRRCCETSSAVTETNGIQLVLSGMQNRTFGPRLTAIHRIHVPVHSCARGTPWNPRTPSIHHVVQHVRWKTGGSTCCLEGTGAAVCRSPGAGKTYTLSSIQADAIGMMPRAAAEIFQHVEADTDHQYTVTMQYLQIYMEVIHVRDAWRRRGVLKP
jgi:Kinesin motor domain